MILLLCIAFYCCFAACVHPCMPPLYVNVYADVKILFQQMRMSTQLLSTKSQGIKGLEKNEIKTNTKFIRFYLFYIHNKSVFKMFLCFSFSLFDLIFVVAQPSGVSSLFKWTHNRTSIATCAALFNDTLPHIARSKKVRMCHTWCGLWRSLSRHLYWWCVS